MTPTAHARLALLALAVFSGAARAADPIDSVNLQVGPKDRVRGTLRPAEERESFLVPVLRGTKVAATARGDGAAAAVPAFDLLDANSTPVATGTATATGARLRGFAFATTGDHRFRVAGDGTTDGDYRLDLSLTPQVTWKGASSADLGPGDETTFAFAAPAGAKATVELRPARGSKLAPLLVDVADPFAVVHSIDGAGAVAARHRVQLDLAEQGEHVLRFRNAGGTAGGWTISVRLRAAKAKRSTVDLRDGVLGGEFEGAQAVFGRVADNDRDTTISIPDGLGLDGVKITVPSGSLGLPTLISLKETTQFFVNDTEHAAGTAISFSPAGTDFDDAKPASVTIPFDPDAFDDPATELSIIVEDTATGAQERVAATSVDTGSSTATFPVSHFSRFQTTSPKPRPLRGRYTELELTGRSTTGYGVELTVGRNGLRVDRGQPRAAGAGTRTTGRFTLAWAVDGAGRPSIRTVTESRTGNAVARVVADEGVLVQAPQGNVPLERGRGGDALTSAFAVGDEVRFHAMLRRVRGKPTAANLMGGWRAQILDVGVARTGEAGLGVVLAAVEFDVDVDEAGRATASGTVVRTSRQIFPDTPWTHAVTRHDPKPGRLRPSGDDVTFRMGGAAAPALEEVTLAPALRGDLLIGVAGATDGDPADATKGALRVVVLSRRAETAVTADLPANLILTGFNLRALNRASAPHPLQFGVTRGDLVVGDDGAASLVATRSLVGHDGQGLAATVQENADATGTAQVAPDGRLTAGKNLGRGVLTPGRAAVLVFSPADGVFPIGLGLPSKPPTK